MFHMHVRYRSRDGGTSCAAARAYIVREGAFKKRGDKVRWAKSLYMPSWAGSGSALRYWKAAEGRHSRENARTAILIEFAVPKELTTDQQNVVALEMAEVLASTASRDRRNSGKLPMTLALHEGHGRNPHVHVVLSTSIADGFDRDAQTWFGRYNPKQPHMGGARRSKFITERGWLYEIRQAWARVANEALVRCGLPAKMDHRSYATQGSIIESQLHLGPAVAHMNRLGISTLRSARFDAVAQRRLEDLELEATIARRRQAVRTLELEEMALDRAQRDWQLACDETLRRLLDGHPLAGGAAELAEHATAMVVESERADAQVSADAQHAGVDMARFVDAVGRSWLPVKSQRACWAVKAQKDSVVMLSRDCAATDGGDEESVEAMIRVAALLALKRPKLVVRDWLTELCIDLVARRGLKWAVEGLTRKVSRLNQGR